MKPTDIPDESLFEAALQCGTAQERVAYLDKVCVGQPELRKKLEILLEAHNCSGAFLEPAVEAPRPTVRIDFTEEEERPGTLIGRYKLLQKIGEGGMGVVYMAEQSHPVVRKVALKIIKLGMDTRQVVARFEAERQALALMDHPHIAKVLDAGATEAGRPYFVMELVHGVPITEYCDKNKLSTQKRLELFIPVCQAIQHAHQKGIIHRDIKPSNVMVTLHDGVPVPKVIDFGVAKAINQRLTEKTLFTHYAQMIGTPAYMSPEQAEMSGLDIDTRSDIYSLGVLLYELLTGTTPFDAKELLSKGYAEMQRMIAEQEPVKPSTRMSTLNDEQRTVVATQRGTEVSTLRKVLQGDLDWIVMKCLEKDRTRRYETANGVAADVRRHLKNELIAARPPTTGYLLRKLLRRHKLAFAGISAVGVSLLTGMALNTWQAARANRLVHELRRTAPAFVEQARGLVAQSKFDEAVAKLDYAVRLRPDVVEYLVFKANLLQCQLKLADAADAYRAALSVKRDDPHATANLKLTEELIDSQNANLGKLPAHQLAKLLSVMQTEQRTAAELLLPAQKLGQEKKLLLAYWLERLKDLPVTGERPLKDRLSLGEAGRLVLDLSDTAVRDLMPLSGMPLGTLTLKNCREVTNLAPLRELPVEKLHLANTRVVDLSAVASLTNLTTLDLASTRVSDLSSLRPLRLHFLDLTSCDGVRDLQPLAGMPLKDLRLRGTRVASLAPLRGTPLKLLDLTFVPARDFEELGGLPLETLLLQSVGVNDLTFLKNMPLRKLGLSDSRGVRGLKVLDEIKTLEILMLPSNVFDLPEPELLAIDSLERHPSLQQITADTGSGLYIQTEATPKEYFWRTWRISRMIGAGPNSVAEEALLAEIWKAQQIQPAAAKADQVLALGRLANSYASAAGPAAAVKVFEAYVSLWRAGNLTNHPGAFAAMRSLADSYVAVGRLTDALPQLTTAAKQDPMDLELQMRAAALQVWQGRHTEYAETCRRTQTYAVTSGNALVLERTAKLCSVTDGLDGESREKVLALARRAVQGGQSYFGWPELSLGMAQYRSGLYQAADQTLAEAQQIAQNGPKDWRARITGIAGFYRSMSLLKAGKDKAARALFSETQKEADWLLINGDKPLASVPRSESYLWYDDLYLWLAFKEARALLTMVRPAQP